MELRGELFKVPGRAAWAASRDVRKEYCREGQRRFGDHGLVCRVGRRQRLEGHVCVRTRRELVA